MAFSTVRLLTVAAIALLPAIGSATPAPRTVAAVSLPLSFTPVFVANLILGKPSSRIMIAGGVLVNEPITGGTVFGSAINGTIESGFAHPPIYENGTLQVPIIDLYGTTDDGQAFYIHEEGIGSNAAQVTRIVSLSNALYVVLIELTELDSKYMLVERDTRS